MKGRQIRKQAERATHLHQGEGHVVVYALGGGVEEVGPVEGEALGLGLFVVGVE